MYPCEMGCSLKSSYSIATNYILGFDPELKNETKNFFQADAAEASKSGTLQQFVDEKFGEDE